MIRQNHDPQTHRRGKYAIILPEFGIKVVENQDWSTKGKGRVKWKLQYHVRIAQYCLLLFHSQFTMGMNVEVTVSNTIELGYCPPLLDLCIIFYNTATYKPYCDPYCRLLMGGGRAQYRTLCKMFCLVLSPDEILNLKS